MLLNLFFFSGFSSHFLGISVLAVGVSHKTSTSITCTTDLLFCCFLNGTIQGSFFSCFIRAGRASPGDPGHVEQWCLLDLLQPIWGTQFNLQMTVMLMFHRFPFQTGKWFLINQLTHSSHLILSPDLDSHPVWRFHSMLLAHLDHHLQYHTLAWFNHCPWYHRQSVNQLCLQFFRRRVNHAVCSLLPGLWQHANLSHLFTTISRPIQVKSDWRRSTRAPDLRQPPA